MRLFKEMSFSDVPSYLTCSITGDLFKEPVFLPESGNTYEKEALLTYWKSSGKIKDPLTNMKLTSSQMYTNWTKKREVEEYVTKRRKEQDGFEQEVREHKEKLKTFYGKIWSSLAQTFSSKDVILLISLISLQWFLNSRKLKKGSHILQVVTSAPNPVSSYLNENLLKLNVKEVHTKIRTKSFSLEQGKSNGSFLKLDVFPKQLDLSLLASIKLVSPYIWIFLLLNVFQRVVLDLKRKDFSLKFFLSFYLMGLLCRSQVDEIHKFLSRISRMQRNVLVLDEVKNMFSLRKGATRTQGKLEDIYQFLVQSTKRGDDLKLLLKLKNSKRVLSFAEQLHPQEKFWLKEYLQKYILGVLSENTKR
eukprot:maker-scaffold_54-snap-gene-0.47-mRNA-1 protein AED:0.18 eAED:0.18 QI:79/1/1/1/0.5/0.33/3/696/360